MRGTRSCPRILRGSSRIAFRTAPIAARACRERQRAPIPERRVRVRGSSVASAAARARTDRRFRLRHDVAALLLLVRRRTPPGTEDFLLRPHVALGMAVAVK